MKKVTIQDIADALGVSRNTVSKAINNAEGLADATRERILQKAVEMGYKQFSYVHAFSAVSDGDAGNQTLPGLRGEIALLTNIFLTQSHFASTMLDKFQREVSLLGYSMGTYRVSEADLRAKSLPVGFLQERVKAIICIEMFDYDYDEMLCELGIPVLFVDGPCKLGGRSLPADQLYMDNSQEISRFVTRQLDRGLRRIGFVGNYRHCQSFYERYLAFRGAMLLGGAEVEEDWCIFSNRITDTIVEELAQMQRLPDVFLCANDFVAWELVRALYSIGKTVPEDVRILGFDDAPESRIMHPPLSTVHIHTQVMAFSAVQLLMSRLKEPSLDYRIVHTQTDLIERESTGYRGGESR